jgi:hypothetical protein
MILIAPLFWILFAVGCAISASNKNRSVLVGFYGGFFWDLLDCSTYFYLILKKNLLMLEGLSSRGKLL